MSRRVSGIQLTAGCGVALAMIFSAGCAGLGPSTQEGSLTGGAIGAVTGAVIGHNRDDGKSLEGAIIGGALGAIAGGVWGNRIDHETGQIYDPQGREYTRTVYRRIPRPPRVDLSAEQVTPSPSESALWISGHWDFDESRYRWRKGHWEVPPPGFSIYVAAHWEAEEGGYVYVPSHWR